MSATFKTCLEKRRIMHFPEAKHLVDPEIEDAENDLKSAKEELEKNGYKWVIWDFGKNSENREFECYNNEQIKFAWEF